METVQTFLIIKIALGAILFGGVIGAVTMREYLLTKFDLKRK